MFKLYYIFIRNYLKLLTSSDSSTYHYFYFDIVICFLGKYRWNEGFVSGTVYYYDPDLVNLTAEVYRLTLYSNPIHSDVFPGICKMEAEIIRIVADLFHGSDDTCGSV